MYAIQRIIYISKPNKYRVFWKACFICSLSNRVSRSLFSYKLWNIILSLNIIEIRDVWNESETEAYVCSYYTQNVVIKIKLGNSLPGIDFSSFRSVAACLRREPFPFLHFTYSLRIFFFHFPSSLYTSSMFFSSTCLTFYLFFVLVCSLFSSFHNHKKRSKKKGVKNKSPPQYNKHFQFRKMKKRKWEMHS